MRNITIILSLAALCAISCAKKEVEKGVEKGLKPEASNVNFTPCKQDNLKADEISDKVNVDFTNKGVEITYKDFEVTCDFTTVKVTHTFVNGVLRITQKGTPSEAKCICHTDVSYTIEGISQNEVNVIFINGEQVYCHNDNQTKNLLVGKWRASNYQAGRSDVIVFTENLRVQQYFDYILAGQPNTTMYPAPYVTYLLSGDEITFTVHWFYPNAENSSETFKYVLNGNSLIIKGFTNPFSDTKEARGDVHFTKIEDNGNQSTCDKKVIISGAEYEKALEEFPITELKIVGNCLKIKYNSDICDSRTWKLIDAGIVAESLPCQRSLRFSLDTRADFECDAIMPLVKEMCFNIESLQIKGNSSVILHIAGKTILYEY